MRVPAGVTETTGLIRVGPDDGSPAAGTGIRVNLIDRGRVFSYVVTSRHLVDGARTGLASLWLPGAAGLALTTDCHFHQDPAVDLAAWQWRSGSGPQTAAAIPSDWLVTPDRLRHPLSQGLELAYLDWPVPDGQTAPVVREGRLASGDARWLERPGGRSDYFLVECSAGPLCSGSPLLMPSMTLDGRPAVALLGIVAEPPPCDPGSEDLPPAGPSLALATPARHILELLWQADVTAAREAGGAGRLKRRPQAPLDN